MADKQLLSHDEVRAIADLARLALSDEEITLYAAQLSAILGDFQALQSVDTSQISLTASVLPLTSVMREDVPAAALTPAQVIANAPQADENQFLVGAVLGDE